MIRTRNIFLIGLPGVGKSTIGKQLAQKLKMDFFDTDEVIEKRSGAEISWIFDIEGEDGFRKREQAIIHELTEKQGVILATGGGSILTKENRVRLSARGTVIYLKATLSQHVKRTEKDTKRPLLQVQDKQSEFEKMQVEREPLYKELADVTIDTSNSSIRSVVTEIINALDKKGL